MPFNCYWEPEIRARPFRSGQQLKIAQDIVYDCVVADFNGDGKLDLAVSVDVLVGSNYIVVYLGEGDGTFSPPIIGPVGTSNYNGRLAVGDFNGDGKLDLATSAGYPFLGNGDGAFQPPLQFYNSGLPGFLRGYVTVGDFNNDGKLDAIIDVFCSGHQGPACLGLFLGQGNGSFEGPLQVAPDPVMGGAMMAAADLNSDGNLDLLFSNFDASLVRSVVGVLLGNGDGTFHKMTEVSEPFWSLYNLYSLVLTDLNGDGKPDLAVTVNNQDVCVFLGNGDGTFTLAGNFGTLTQNPAGTIAGLFQRTSKIGWSDFLVANTYGAAMVLFNNSR